MRVVKVQDAFLYERISTYQVPHQLLKISSTENLPKNNTTLTKITDCPSETTLDAMGKFALPS